MRKAISLFLTITMLIAVLPSCGVSKPDINVWQEVPSVPQTNERLSVFCVGDLRDSGMIQLALNLYQKMYPDIQVELIKPEFESGDYNQRDELYQQVAAQIMAGAGPDVFLVDDAVMDVEKPWALTPQTPSILCHAAKYAKDTGACPLTPCRAARSAKPGPICAVPNIGF